MASDTAPAVGLVRRAHLSRALELVAPRLKLGGFVTHDNPAYVKPDVPGPVLSNDLFSAATLELEDEAEKQLRFANRTMAQWFAGGLREAYLSGLKDGYAQGVADGHRSANAR